MTLKPLTAPTALELYFLEARAKLLDLAAIFDRLERGDNFGRVREDARFARLRTALTILEGDGADRAEQLQQLFSLDYDPAWPQPR
jgi:hypothetical protein